LGYFNFAAVHGGKLVEFITHIEADQKAPEVGDRESDMTEGTAERSPFRLEMVTLNPDPGIGKSKAPVLFNVTPAPIKINLFSVDFQMTAELYQL